MRTTAPKLSLMRRPRLEPPESLDLPPPGPSFQEGGSSGSGAQPAPELAFAPLDEGEDKEKEEAADASGAVPQSQVTSLPPGLDVCQGGVPPPPAPPTSASQELAIALGRLKVNTDKARLEQTGGPERSQSSVNYGTVQRQMAEPKRGETAALAAVAEIYKDAINFWKDL